MVVQAFVSNSQRNINARASEPRGSSRRRIGSLFQTRYVPSVLLYLVPGWDVLCRERDMQGESWTVYHRQPTQTKFHPPPGPQRSPPLAQAQLSHGWSRRGNVLNIIKPARSFSSPWTLGSFLPLATPPCAPIVETRQIHFALVRARSHVFEGLGRPITGCPRCVEWRCCHHHHLGVPVVVSGSFRPLSVKAVCMCANPSRYTAPPAAASTPSSKKKSRK